jgi:outer membrane lipoprotein-sorting protein
MYFFVFIFLFGHSITCFPISDKNEQKTEQNTTLLKRLEEYLDLLPTIKASFIQINPDGEAIKGMLYIDRKKKKMRLDYKEKKQVIVVTDGFLFLHDINENTIQEMDAAYTPAGLLLQPKIKFNSNVYVQELIEKEDGTYLTLTDNKEGDHGSMTFYFSTKSFIKLKGWTVKDMQSNETTVTIDHLEGGIPLDENLFKKPQTR